MEFDAILIPPRRSTMTEQGLWSNRTINDDLDACVASCPDQLALTAVSMESGVVTSFTYREMAAMADRIAVGLSRLGVGRNDVVSMQLPNWWQFTLTYLACSRIGAVLNPLMHIFRERELSFMLKHGHSKVVIVPKQFRGFDHERMIVGLRPNLPALQHIIVVGGADDNSFEKLLSEPRWEEAPHAKEILTRHRPGPDDITQLIYTSGTTGEPKGVMHSANTTMANIIPYAERRCLRADDVVLMASPMAHQTGFMYGLMMPIMLRGRAVLQDIWDPKKAVELIRSEGVTFTMASTPFLTDLAKVVSESGAGVPTLRSFLCAGAPIPGPLVENARKVLGAKIVSAWGMTEIGAVTLIKLDDDDERAFNTAGCPLPGVEICVVDAAGKPLPNGTEGTLLVRSCSNFGGYLRRPHLNSTDEEGWFDTGDLAEIDDRGYVRITGRSKDVIIRGGENIPVVEIETLLYKHPAIGQVAIVAYPDERLGERGCAVVVPKPGQVLDLPVIVDFLKSQKVALQYIPERLVVLDQMPATPSGKIQKFRLRDIVKQSTG
jgi:cyclohexanecarboxylate-CoA ligase